MNVLDDASPKCRGEDYLKPGSTNITVQLGLSLILGVSAFVAFCVCPGGPFYEASSCCVTIC